MKGLSFPPLMQNVPARVSFDVARCGIFILLTDPQQVNKAFSYILLFLFLAQQLIKKPATSGFF
jgi:hypothetical protein